MARLIRTEKEIEGRYEEVWLVVDEDALEQWPAGPREVVGRPAARKTGPLRARGEARYTADIRLPGMLHAAVLRSPHAHARVKKISFDEALVARAVAVCARENSLAADRGHGSGGVVEVDVGWLGVGSAGRESSVPVERVGSEPVKHFETRSCHAVCATSSVGSLIQATVGSFGGWGRRCRNRAGLAA